MTTTVPINIHHINARVYRVHELGNGLSSLKVRSAGERQPASVRRATPMDNDVAERRISLLLGMRHCQTNLRLRGLRKHRFFSTRFSLAVFMVIHRYETSILLTSEYCRDRHRGHIPAEADVGWECKMHRVWRTAIQPRVIGAECHLG